MRADSQHADLLLSNSWISEPHKNSARGRKLRGCPAADGFFFPCLKTKSSEPLAVDGGVVLDLFCLL